MIKTLSFLFILFVTEASFANFDAIQKRADRLNDNGYAEQAHNEYKKSYSEISTRAELISTFAALAVTANKLGRSYEAGAYIDRLRTIKPQDKWSKRFVAKNNIVIPKKVLLIGNESYRSLMLSGDLAYEKQSYQIAYVQYLKGLSAASTLNELIVSLASLSVASNETHKNKEAVIYLKRLSFLSPDNQWAKTYAKNIGAKNVNTLTRQERHTIISNVEERQTYQYSNKMNCSNKPVLACSPSEADTIAIGMCITVMGGCEVIQKDMEATGTYLTDQACNALVNNMTGQEQTLDSMLLTAVGSTISEAASNARNSDDFLTKLIFGVVFTAAEISFKATIFDQCKTAARKNCRQIYNEWQYGC